jgi:hypothetical protein
MTEDQATGEFSVYVDGVKTSVVVTGTMVSDITDVKIGADVYNSTYFKGRIDEPAPGNCPAITCP